MGGTITVPPIHTVSPTPEPGGRNIRGPSVLEPVIKKLRIAWQAAKQVFYGMTTFGWARDMRRERGEVERLFVLVTFGDMLGLPILPPYYTLRLLPFIVPAVSRWKRNLLRERDWTDLTGLIDGVD